MPPNQYIITMMTFIIRETNGKLSDISRMARMLVFANSSFAALKRFFSYSERPNALITRMPARFSCITTFTLSSLSCMHSNMGIAYFIMTNTSSPITTMPTSTTSDSRGLMAKMAATPPMHKNGARTSMRMQVVNAFWI